MKVSCWKDFVPVDEVNGSGIIKDGEITNWHFGNFPETPEDSDLRYKISKAILGK